MRRSLEFIKTVKPIIERQNHVVHDLVVKHVMSYVAPIIFGLAPGGEHDGEMTQNGSCSLLEVGGRRFIVTNDHVLRGYEELRGHERARFQVGDASPFEPKVISRDPALDLAIIDGSNHPAAEIAERGGHIPLYPIRPAKWPLERVKVGDFIAFGGWPQVYRRGEHGERIVTTASWSISAAPVTDVGPDRFYCALDREGWQTAFDCKAAGVEFSDFGGLSGCPAFVLRDLSFEFVGVLSDYGPNWDTMFFVHADRIGTDGQLSPGRPSGGPHDSPIVNP